jgi:hypothetical protein
MTTVSIARTFYVEVDGSTGAPTGFIFTDGVAGNAAGKFTLDSTSLAALGIQVNASKTKYRVAVNAIQSATQNHPNNPILPTDGSYVLHHNSKRVSGATIS